MTASSSLPAPNLMPLMRYRDLAEAMGWLEQAFGFEKQIAVSDGDGGVIYGQMTYRGSVMMMGAVRDTDLDKLMRQPDEVGGVETQSCYLVVEDADAHYAMAQDAGADVVLELKSDGLGRRGYSCRDPEGHIWNFGTYNPGRGLAVTLAGAAAEGSEPPRRSGRVAISLAALFVAFGATCWVFADSIRADLSMRIATAAGHQSAREAENAYRELVKVRAEKRKAEETAQAASAALAIERARRLALESNPGSDAVSKLTEAESARRAAEAAVATLREELARKQNALDAAIEAKRVSEEKLAVNAAKPEAGSQNAAPIAGEPPLARSAAQPQTPSGDRNGIETSATRSAPEDEGSRADETATDGDDESRGAGSIAFSRAGPSRPASTVAQRRKSSASKRRYPAYVVDLDHVWPYNGWQN